MLALASTLAVEHIWHFWLAVALAPLIILTIIGIAVLYVYKVTRTRYPQQ